MTKMDEIDEALATLGELFVVTGVDWVFSLSQILTEPVCPTLEIAPEGYAMTRYRVDRGPIGASLLRLIARVKREVLDGVVDDEHGECPFTNPDDVAFARWLRERGPFPKPAGGRDDAIDE